MKRNRGWAKLRDQQPSVPPGMKLCQQRHVYIDFCVQCLELAQSNRRAQIDVRRRRKMKRCGKRVLAHGGKGYQGVCKRPWGHIGKHRQRALKMERKVACALGRAFVPFTESEA